MRTITFNQLLKESAFRLGAVPDLTDITDGFGTRILPQLISYLSDANERAWNAFPWPETIERDEIETTGESIIPWANVDQAQWASAWLENPDTSARARELPMRQVPEGLLVVPWSRSGEPRVIPASVWLLWRPKAPRFTAEEFDGGATYALGDLVWDRTATGECYEAAVTNPNPTLSDPTQWLLQPVLLILRVAIQKFAHATHLREREKFGAAQVLEQEALTSLEEEWERASQFQQYTLGKR